jgi:prepilin-type N-terminal cleavage/methylation domain-containing protein
MHTRCAVGAYSIRNGDSGHTLPPHTLILMRSRLGKSSGSVLGHTLIELIVVLAIMSLAAAVVLPALLRARTGTTPVQTVIESARDAAAHRGETISLRIDPSGTWHMHGTGSALEADSATGHVTPLATAPLTLLVAPSGSCAFDVRSAAAAHGLSLDPLSCVLASVTASSS